MLIGILALAVPLALAQEPAPLVPAGPINGALGGERILFLVEDHPAALKQAKWVRERFFADRSELLVGEACVEADLSGTNLIVYGTAAGHPWIRKHVERLPFRMGAGAVELEGRHEGDHLRVLCSVKNPDDLQRRAALYVTEHASDLIEINGVFHGPTEYVVADGPRVLASGGFSGGDALSPAALHADFDAFVSKLLAVHPRTADGSWAALDEAIDEAYGALDHPMDRLELWFTLMPVVAAFEDAHTTLDRPVAQETFPLPLAWTDAGLMVSRDAGELRAGDRVLSLGGATEAQLFAALAPLIPADNDHWRRAQGAGWLADAALLEALGLVERDRLRVELRRGEQQLDVRLPKGPIPEAGPGAEPDPDWVRWSFHHGGRLAVFTLDRCVVDGHFLTRLARFFEEVRARGTETVAIDLRENSGGNSGVCDEFLKYLPVESFRNYTAAIRTSAESKAQRGDPAEVGLLRYGPQVRENPRHGESVQFDGELVVLTSARTFSSGVWFATVLVDNGLARCLGAPTGGAPSGYGDILQFTLPESSLSLWISYKQWIRPDPARDPADTLAPDVPVVTTPAHVAGGVDPVLAALLDAFE